jgi:hypothetical protein
MAYQRIKKILIGSIVALIAVEVVLLWPNKSTAVTVPCELGTCPHEIRITDNTNTFTYKVGWRFNVVLDEKKYPSQQLRCETDDGVLEHMLTLDDLYPNYAKRFELKAPGTCFLQSKDFKVTIVSVPRKQPAETASATAAK